MAKREERFENTTPGKSRTHQSFADDADINTIMGQYRKTGFVTNVKLGTPVYADFSNADDYRTSVNEIKRAQNLFMSLPARVRARVDNDPAKLIAFVEDPANADELVQLGLAEPVATTPVAPENKSELESTAIPAEEPEKVG